VVTTIDGQAVDSVCTLRRLVGLHRPGDVVAVGYRRGGADAVVQVKTVAGRTVGPDERPVLGVALAERDPHPPFPVTIALNDVGGPSAGLMFALGIYDRLTPGDLTGGQIVAGTGSIDDDGTVGAIGGIAQKLIAARDHGARWFLTPTGNYDEASRAVPKGLRLIRVASMRDGLTALKAIAAGRSPA
jgi:PDZ domain-containing protein